MRLLKQVDKSFLHASLHNIEGLLVRASLVPASKHQLADFLAESTRFLHLFTCLLLLSLGQVLAKNQGLLGNLLVLHLLICRIVVACCLIHV